MVCVFSYLAVWKKTKQNPKHSGLKQFIFLRSLQIGQDSVEAGSPLFHMALAGVAPTEGWRMYFQDDHSHGREDGTGCQLGTQAGLSVSRFHWLLATGFQEWASQESKAELHGILLT